MATPAPRVLLLGLNFAPEHTGIAPYSTGIAAGLARGGAAVRALTSHPHYPAWRISPGYGQWSKNERLRGVRIRRLLHYVPRSPKGTTRLLSEISFGLRASLSRWGRPNVIVAVSPALFSSAIALFRARLTHRRVPFVVWVQDLYAQGMTELGGAGLASAAVRRVEEFLLRRSDAVVVIHERFADKIVTDFGIPRDRVHVIRNWTHIAPNNLDRDEARTSLGWSPDDLIVLHAGNMGAKQGLENVVEAARLARAEDQKVQFVLIGGGSELERLRSMAGDLETLQFVKPVGDAEFPIALRAADILLVNERPGVAEMALPSKLTSYFAAARPVIAATHPDGMTATELRAAQAGEVVTAGDPRALLEAINSLIADPERAARLGANGLEYQATVLSESKAVNSFREVITSAQRTRVGVQYPNCTKRTLR